MVSGKQKKEKLKQKRNEKRTKASYQDDDNDDNDNLIDNNEINHITKKDMVSPGMTPLASQFLREDDIQVSKRRTDAMRPLDLSKREILMASKSVTIGFPKRPAWDESTTKEELHQKEVDMFEKWIHDVHSKYTFNELPPFEHNLDVWRQLWHTCEKSDMMLLVADVRNPILHMPQAFCDYILNELKIPMVVCLTKTDLVSENHISTWKAYLAQMFPKIKFFWFASRAGRCPAGGVASRRRFITKVATNADKATVFGNARRLLEVCIEQVRAREPRSVYQDKIPTIGIVGHPNVGKSTLVNSIMGEKVASVSRSCGHTKHWQTLYVEEDGERIAMLCDSPGLIFPITWSTQDEETAPRHVFESCGLYPIPQIREAFSAVRFIGEHLPLERYYNLQLNIDDYDTDEWSPYSICGTLAEQKGYNLSGTSAPDTHRAGLEIIRDCVDGYLVLEFAPPTL